MRPRLGSGSGSGSGGRAVSSGNAQLVLRGPEWQGLCEERPAALAFVQVSRVILEATAREAKTAVEGGFEASRAAAGLAESGSSPLLSHIFPALLAALAALSTPLLCPVLASPLGELLATAAGALVDLECAARAVLLCDSSHVVAGELTFEPTKGGQGQGQGQGQRQGQGQGQGQGRQQQWQRPEEQIP